MRLCRSSKTFLKEIPAQPDERVSQEITDEYAESARDARPRGMRGSAGKVCESGITRTGRGSLGASGGGKAWQGLKVSGELLKKS